MIINADRVVKNFGGLTAVKRVTLEVDAGQIIGLIGPNGAGKTTFLNCVAGTYPPSAGKVRFQGKETTGSSPEDMCRMGLSRTFQIPRPFPRLTALENVLVGAVFGAQHDSKIRPQKRAEEALEFVEFPMDIDTPADRLNAVQLKRLDLARALACGPNVLIADEPTTALDVTIQAQILELMKALQAETDMAILFITHDLGVIAEMADEVAVMYLGKIVEMAAYRDTYADPKHPYTQALISAIPLPQASQSETPIILEGDIPSPIHIPPGCRFHTRCPIAAEICSQERPVWRDAGGGHWVACHRCTTP